MDYDQSNQFERNVLRHDLNSEMKKKNILLVCHSGPSVGIGHLSRLLALAKYLKKSKKFKVEFLIFGDYFKSDELKAFKINQLDIKSDFESSLNELMKKRIASVIVFDLFTKLVPKNIEKVFASLKEKNITLVGVDGLLNHSTFLDILWIPSLIDKLKRPRNFRGEIISGWNALLIQKRLTTKKWKPGSKVLVLTGGSDTTGLAKDLPSLIDELLRHDSIINWIQGPFSKRPVIPKKSRLSWNVHFAPSQLDKFINENDYVLTVFGISFFEALQYGIPSVVFSPYGEKDKNDLRVLSKEEVTSVANSSYNAVIKLKELMKNDHLSKKYSSNSLKKMSLSGSENLTNKILSLKL